MNHEPHVGFIDSHAKRDCSDDDLQKQKIASFAALFANISRQMFPLLAARHSSNDVEPSLYLRLLNGNKRLLYQNWQGQPPFVRSQPDSNWNKKLKASLN